MQEDQRSITIGTASYDAMWADMASHAIIQEPPPGAMSIRQFADKFTGGRLSAAASSLATLEREGRVRCETMRVDMGGQIRSVRFYIPIAASSPAKKAITKRL